MRWYDPKKNFKPPETRAGLAVMLQNQLDPQPMADVIVQVILSDNPKFRNVHPKETEEMIKQIQKDAWTALS
jgi:hypothetical protein